MPSGALLSPSTHEPTMRFFPTIALALTAATSSAALAQNDIVVPAGSTLVYNTDVNGQIRANRFIVEAGANFVAIGRRPLSITAASVRIDGVLSAKGVRSPGAQALNLPIVPAEGGAGAAGGGRGGTGSAETMTSTPKGLDGGESYNMINSPFPQGGGHGGDTGYYNGVVTNVREDRAGAGGGGGALAADQPVNPDPLDRDNIGLIALAGGNSGAGSIGATSGLVPARGGLPGLPVFTDGNANNDFWGAKLAGSGVILGELGRPLPGRGGGGGGDASRTATFPMVPFSFTGDERGAGGGGGGGLVLILARLIEVGPDGLITADGGAGGAGENVVFFDRIGGGSGGGSGGWIVLEALQIDLSQVSETAVTSLGGMGGAGRMDRFLGDPNFGPEIEGAGGHGGPGVIQLHVPSGLESDISLPAGKTVSDITRPAAHVLLPALSR